MDEKMQQFEEKLNGRVNSLTERIEQLEDQVGKVELMHYRSVIILPRIASPGILLFLLPLRTVLNRVAHLSGFNCTLTNIKELLFTLNSVPG